MNPDTPSAVEIISPHSQLDFISEWYELADETHFWMKWRLAAFLNQLKRNKIPLDSPLKGLEIGSGRGIFRKQMEDNSQWTIDGADLDLNSLKSNPPSKGKSYLYNIFDRNESFKNKYDMIFLFDVIEHIDDDRQFLETAFFNLKNNGLVFINVPALPMLFSNYDVFVGHKRRYTVNSMHELLKKCGLNVIDIQYWGLSLVALLLLRKAMLMRYNNSRDIVHKGFAPPNQAFNKAMINLMRLENSLVPRPFLGTSVLAIARKES